MSDTTELVVWPSFDHRETPGDRRGCGSARLVLILRGTDGVLTCEISTDWMARPLLVPYLQVQGSADPWPRDPHAGIDRDLRGYHRGPRPGGVHLHCATRRKDWWLDSDGCPYFDGATCYGDTGYLIADEVFDALVSGGSAAAFDRMREILASWLSDDEQDD